MDGGDGMGYNEDDKNTENDLNAVKNKVFHTKKVDYKNR
jgi:hypothetical protein